MFSSSQRLLILKWGGLTLFSLSLLPLLMHGVFFIVLFQYYLPAAIIGYAIYFSYHKIKHIDIYDVDTRTTFKSFFARPQK